MTGAPGRRMNLRRTASAMAAALAFLCGGCATATRGVGDEPAKLGDEAATAAEVIAPSNAPAAATAPAAAQSASSAPAPSPAVAAGVPPDSSKKTQPAQKTSAPKPPTPKPWKVELKPGSSSALFDGVRVFLCHPAIPRKVAKGGAVASPLDQRLTVAAITRARATPLVNGRALRVCLDPGHGGEDSGALSRDGKTLEKTVVLDLARRLKRLLEADGCEVLMTRESDRSYPTLNARVARASRWKADLFVSLHLNANEKNDPRGVETYATAPKGSESTSWTGASPRPESNVATPGNAHDVGNAQLGFCIQRRLVAASGLPDRGLRRARYIVLRDAMMPAVLVECGFVTNERDLAVLRSSAGRGKIARGIYEGICDFALGTMAPGLPAHVSGTGGLGVRTSGQPDRSGDAQQKPRQQAQPAGGGAHAAATSGTRPISFVSGGDSRVAPYSAPKPQDGQDAESLRAARQAALRAAGF